MASARPEFDIPVASAAPNFSLELPPRPWLEADPTGTKLSIWDTDRTRVSQPKTLNLDVILPDGSSLLDALNIDWLQLVVSYTYLIRDEPEKPVQTAGIHRDKVRRLLTFLKWARLNYLYDLRRMTPALAERFSSEIALGTGYALRYVDRLQEFIQNVGDDLPIKEDKYCSTRKHLDVGSICAATHIAVQSLSADRVASQLLARLSAKHGYHAPARHAVTDGPLPDPVPLTRVSHSRYIDSIRLLHVWNDQLNGAGLSFVPCPAKSDRPRSDRLRATGHTQNLSPRDVMTLLDASLNWVFEFAPRVLDIFDDVEALHKRLSARAISIDRWSSTSEIEKLRTALFDYLREQDAKGIVPHGSHQIVRHGTKQGYDIARRIVTGEFTPQSRRAALDWLELPDTLSDLEIYRLARRRLAQEPAWASTWPFSPNQLAKQIGICIDSIERFLAREPFCDLTVYERIENFLVSSGAIRDDHHSADSVANVYRSDRGIEKRLQKFISDHPLNQPGDCGPWPIAWNLSKSGRNGSISLYQALRFCIPAAILVVLGVFQARRESELTSITTSCLEEQSGELWMETHIAKTLRRDVKLPTVDVSKIAVDLLSRWGSRGRAMNQSDLLFSYWEPLGGPLKTVKPNVDLNKFAELALDGPVTCRLQIRQFRRFFAISYMWRYRMGSLPALSEFLCHSGIAMTWEYVTERVGTSVMLEAQSEFSREILVSAAIGKTKLHGPFGRLWHRWVEKVRASVTSSITFSEGQDDPQSLFVERIEDGMRMLVPTPGGFCSAGDRPRDIRRAKCSTSDPLNPNRHVKNPELSRPGQCATCPFAATDHAHKDYWQSAAREARSAASLAEPSVLRERARLDVAKLDRIARSFNTDEESENHN